MKAQHVFETYLVNLHDIHYTMNQADEEISDKLLDVKALRDELVERAKETLFNELSEVLITTDSFDSDRVEKAEEFLGIKNKSITEMLAEHRERIMKSVKATQ